MAHRLAAEKVADFAFGALQIDPKVQKCHFWHQRGLPGLADRPTQWLTQPITPS